MSERAGDEPAPRPRWSELKRELESAGFHPSRTLGQNFLVDDNMLRAIVRDAAVRPGDFVVEVGPGCGVLTSQLVAAGAEVLAIEIDERLLDIARSVVGEERATWLQGDALESKHELSRELVAHLPREREWMLVSNLPYSAGTPILVAASRLAHPPRSITVLLQQDLAERITAAPGSKERGAVSVRLQACYDVRVTRSVPSHLFWPRPQVESTVLRFELRPDRPSAAELARLDHLVAVLFEQRRKTVLNRLQSYFGDRARAQAACAEFGLDPKARPEDLPTPAFLALARAPKGGEGPELGRPFPLAGA